MRLARLAAVVGVVAALLIPGAAAHADDSGADDVVVKVPDVGQAPDLSGDRVFTNAQLRWSINHESGGAAFAGGCNFLSAGEAGSTGSSRLWTEADYRAADDRVRIEKPTATGGKTPASWQNKCLEPGGNVVKLDPVTSTSGNEVVIDGGTGTLAGGTLEIEWKGSFTVVFYGGLTYWSATDPVLTLDAAGDGQLRATASGYGASMNDTSAWEKLAPKEIVLADIRAGHVVVVEDAGNVPAGLVATPEYRGVGVTGLPPTLSQVRTGRHWGSFPQSFVDYQLLTGQSAYWFSSGSTRDAAKPAADIYVSYDAAEQIGGGAPPSSADTGAAPVNSTRFRPLPPGVPATAGAGGAGFGTSTALTFMPEREGLVPAAVAALLSPAAVPLLGATLALLVAIISVLNMMGLLPWQQVSLRT